MNNFEITLTEKEKSIRKLAIDITHDIASYLSKSGREDTSTLIDNIIYKLTLILKEPIIIRNHHIISVEENNGERKIHELNNILTTMLLGFTYLSKHSREEEQANRIYQAVTALYEILVQETRTEGWDIIIREGTYELRRAIKSRVGDILEPFSYLVPAMFYGVDAKKMIQRGRAMSAKMKERIDICTKTYSNQGMIIGEREGIVEIANCLDELIALVENKNSDSKEITRLFLKFREIVDVILNVPDTHP